jgi:cellulose biosynthesis protein BcsQ
MEIIAIYSVKGGVGKTTTAVNLAYRCAADGWPTLLWDLDPQAAATYIMRGEEHVRGGAKKLIRGKRATAELVAATDYERLDLLPADFSYRKMDVHLNERKDPAARLLALMRPLQQLYAGLFLDCPPGLSLVSESVMHAADIIVVPLVPSPLSVRTLERLLEFAAVKGWSDLKILPFFSMVDRRRRLHCETVEQLRQRFPMILETEVAYASDFEKITLRRAPVEAYAPGSHAAATYRQLWREIDARLHEAYAATVP